jgi:hypothetical protein
MASYTGAISRSIGQGFARVGFNRNRKNGPGEVEQKISTMIRLGNESVDYGVRQATQVFG